jgi:serine/threonine protein kinase
MGRIYRAVDKKLNEEVALKLIKPEIASEKRTLERFHNQLKLARKISHPNVGRMYEFLIEEGENEKPTFGRFSGLAALFSFSMMLARSQIQCLRRRTSRFLMLYPHCLQKCLQRSIERPRR